jgi:hypothetical protein
MRPTDLKIELCDYINWCEVSIQKANTLQCNLALAKDCEAHLSTVITELINRGFIDPEKLVYWLAVGSKGDLPRVTHEFPPK